VQFGDTDLGYIGYLFDLLGTTAGIAELSRFSRGVPLAVQRDVAVALLSHDQPDAEPVAISLLLDTSAPTWKRGNAAGALGKHGTEAALGPLQQIASQPAATDDLESLRLTAHSALDRLEHRLQAAQADTPAPR
jgi:HEAT repeat protein